MTVSSLAVPSRLPLTTGRRHITGVPPEVEPCRKTVLSGATASTHPHQHISGTHMSMVTSYIIVNKHLGESLYFEMTKPHPTKNYAIAHGICCTLGNTDPYFLNPML